MSTERQPQSEARVGRHPRGTVQNQGSLFDGPEPAAALPAPAALPTEPAPQNTAAAARRRKTVDAVDMASQQREISVSEFFTKNRHLLGFDNPRKALLTTVKEAVDNSLDACEEAGILPEIWVGIEPAGENRFVVRVRDNGPGIVKEQVPKIFGKLLYGSKFHRFRQSRGQQGIGISAAGLYAQLTTGRPVKVLSKPGARRPGYSCEIALDTRRNRPEILREAVLPELPFHHGTEVSMALEGEYLRGRRSVDEYLELTALANPHMTLHYAPPKDEPITWQRVTEEHPPEAKEIKPHPHGVELGTLIKLFKESTLKTVAETMAEAFSRVTDKVAAEICEKARVSPKANPRNLDPQLIERIYKVIPEVKILAPPSNCLVPIGAEGIEQALRARIPAEFFASCSRPPAVYRGNPFQIEVGLAYGGKLPGDELAEVTRFANRVPLLYQAGGCAITKGVISTNWKSYGLQQSKGALPAAPLVLFIHLASVWVPFTSESKEAIAGYPEIVKEIRLALMEVGRQLGRFLSKRARLAAEEKKRSYITKYLPQIGVALQDILGLPDRQRDDAVTKLRTILEHSRSV